MGVIYYDAASYHGNAGDHIPDFVEKGAADIQIVMAGLSQKKGAYPVYHQTEGAHCQHMPDLYLFGRDKSHYRLIHQIGADEEQDNPVDKGGHNLRPVESISPFLGRGTLGQDNREIAHPQGKQVGKHMPGIGNKRKAVSD